MQEGTSNPPKGGNPFTQKLLVRNLIKEYKILAKTYNATCVPKGFPYRNPNAYDMYR